MRFFAFLFFLQGFTLPMRITSETKNDAPFPVGQLHDRGGFLKALDENIAPDAVEVCEEFYDMVWRVCFVLMRGNRQDAEDAAQNVFLKYIEAAVPPEPGEHTKAWLLVTARNTCLSMLRRSHRRDAPLDALNDRGSGFPYNETADAVMRLPEKERTAVVLCLYEGYTAKEAGKLMGCPENTVYSHLHRAKKKLKKELGE